MKDILLLTQATQCQVKLLVVYLSSLVTVALLQAPLEAAEAVVKQKVEEELSKVAGQEALSTLDTFT